MRAWISKVSYKFPPPWFFFLLLTAKHQRHQSSSPNLKPNLTILPLDLQASPDELVANLSSQQSTGTPLAEVSKLPLIAISFWPRPPLPSPCEYPVSLSKNVSFGHSHFSSFIQRFLRLLLLQLNIYSYTDSKIV